MLQSDVNLLHITFWLDAHLSPSVAKWLQQTYNVEAASLRFNGLLVADDIDIFKAAKQSNVILISKDRDMMKLIEKFGSPPKLIWLTCGNTSNKALKAVIANNFEAIIDTLIINNLPFIEITN